MKKRSASSDGKMMEHARGLGTVTPDMVSQRAHEIAEINQRANNKPTPEDWQEARRELTTLGEDSTDPVEQIAESKRWDPVPGTAGHKVGTVQPEDEQTLAEQLVSDGVEEADHEQMVEGTRESVRRDEELGEGTT